MIANPAFFTDLAYVLIAAVLGGALAWLARQPLILGYVVGGLLVSPRTPGPSLSDLRTFEVFAEIGVVLLMFSIGIIALDRPGGSRILHPSAETIVRPADTVRVFALPSRSPPSSARPPLLAPATPRGSSRLAGRRGGRRAGR